MANEILEFKDDRMFLARYKVVTRLRPEMDLKKNSQVSASRTEMY